MTILPKRVLFTVFLALFLGITNLFSQSETEKIDSLIEQKRVFNKKNKSSIVYKIQLYNGNESEAYKIKLNFNISFPEYEVNIIYKSPEWKTQVGNFYTRLEADRALYTIKEKYTGAIVLEDRI